MSVANDNAVSPTPSRRDQAVAALGLHELLGDAIEAFFLALAAHDLATARDAFAAFIDFDPPSETPRAALQWRARQIRTLAEKLALAECAPKRI
jgi:alpha-D-ribose 1-methylphosphonate 5-triphosphate synthase subunit PhnI